MYQILLDKSCQLSCTVPRSTILYGTKIYILLLYKKLSFLLEIRIRCEIKFFYLIPHALVY